MLKYPINSRTTIATSLNASSIEVDLLTEMDMWPLPFDRLKDIEELIVSISKHGMYQSIMASRIQGDNRLQLLCGRRRFYALTELQSRGIIVPFSLDTVLHLNMEDAKHDCALLNMIESSPRKDASPMEYAEKIDLLVRQGMSYKTIAEKLCHSEPCVRAYARLVQLPLPLQQALSDGSLSFSHARLLQSKCPKDHWLERGEQAKDMTYQQFDKFLKSAYP